MAGVQRTGKAFIRLDGVLYETLKGAKLTIGGVNRPDVTGSAVFGYREEVVPAELEASFAHGGPANVATIQAMAGVTITVECDTGEVYVMGNAWNSENPKVDFFEGKIDAKFKSPPATLQA
jgi:hypothetical protein